MSLQTYLDDFDNEVTSTSGSDIHQQIATVGTGVVVGFDHTSNLHVTKYDHAMKSKDKNEWKWSVEKEKESFKKHKVYKLLKRKNVPKGAKIVTSTWTMKKKASGKYRTCCNMRGYKQQDGQHYDLHLNTCHK